MKLGNYDVVVIGAGHAGIEAAISSARLGAKTALFTLTLDGVGNMPCNPAIGGTAKGHLVKEVDALGGMMGKAADATSIQTRMLNRGKGPAVHSLRVQSDRTQYQMYMKKLCENTENLDLKQAEITEILFDDSNSVVGVKTKLNSEYSAKAVVIATGTYLTGKIFVGNSEYLSGPDGHHAAVSLSECLKEKGIELRRFKTGTPARVHKRSINFDVLEIQPGDEEAVPFSFMTRHEIKNDVPCHISYTNLKTHKVIQDNIHKSPLFGGKIEGVGPRYCPSIEDKVVRFPDKDRHQLFIEPCGVDTDEMYLQGMSSSLPEDVQFEFYRTIEGLENLEIMRPAYAIEYDSCNPLDLKASLEFKNFSGLYGAGQFNGTSGYEEAAAQGLVAGVNAARKINGQDEFILPRQSSYIGTLIDDLITKGVSDPYRMMTSRSEYRLFLRQDNADERLTPIGREIGLVCDDRWDYFIKTQELKEREIQRLSSITVKPSQFKEIMIEKNLPELSTGIRASELLKRPQISYDDIVRAIGREDDITNFISEKVSVELKYSGYVKRQEIQINQAKKLENTKIPDGFNYSNLKGLRLEAREKLEKIKPVNVAQASRIPGVSPSDISSLLLELKMKNLK